MNEKRIAYLITHSGVDGRAPTQVIWASWDEEERDAKFDKDPNKCYNSKDERIINITQARKTALGSLDGIQQLILGLNLTEDICNSCNRESLECSLNPCPAVIEDRK